MENLPSFLSQIKNLIAEDELEQALQLLRQALASDMPRLNDAIHQAGRFKHLRKQIQLGTVSFDDATLTRNQIRFGLLDFIREIEQEGRTSLPQDLRENLISGGNTWSKNLKLVLQKFVAVDSKPDSIYQQYGWLIAEFLRKMETPVGRELTLRRLSFMAEAFQSSLRYLCFIQVSQILQQEQVCRHPLLTEFLEQPANGYLTFDYWNLLLVTTDLLRERESFVPEITDTVDELSDTGSDLYGAAVFLQDYRTKLLDNAISTSESLPELLEQYLTALVYWLRYLAFLAKYRLVSIKDINLKYRLGTGKYFVHQYGELHGMYTADENYEYPEYEVEDLFTYNQSVLLFRGSSVKDCLDHIEDESTFISLSPFVIDQSVFANKVTQTPEIYYFTGYHQRQYHFAKYKNELVLGGPANKNSNIYLRIKATNLNQPKYDELFEQLEQVCKPFKTLS